MKKVSLCYAVYQNAGTLEALYLRSKKAMEENFTDLEFEFVFVNDGSTDGSLEELRMIKAKHQDQRIKIVSFTRNFGQVAAILAGWAEATGDAVINLAADLQDPPEQCAPMVREWLGGRDVVISFRKSHASSFINKVTSKLAYRMLLPSVPDGGFDFTLLSRRAVEAMMTLPDRNRFYQHDVLWVGFNPVFIPYNKAERSAGRSQWNFMKRLNYFLTCYINVSYTPLRFMTLVGAAFALAGVVYSLLITYFYFRHETPFEGWAPIMVLLLIIGGLIMLMLGVIGEYLWRVFDETKRRPIYLIKERM
jgi:glycosyltransferase involved in cell wall biosynthesis